MILKRMKIVIFISIVAFISAGTYCMVYAIFAAQRYTFSFDSSLSSWAKQSIQQHVKKLTKKSFSSIAQALKQECPCIDAVSIERRANKTIHVCVCAISPSFCLDKEHVLLKNSSVVTRDNYTACVLETLPMVTLRASLCPSLGGQAKDLQCPAGSTGKRPADISPAFKQWLLQFPQSLLSEYKICWADDYEIHVIDQKSNGKTIVCTVLNSINPEVVEKCQRIIREKNKNAQGTASSIFYTADIRFEKQIIICSQKGGACYG